MHPFVPETVGQPVCVGSTEDGGADAGVKLLALGITGVPPGVRPFCGAYMLEFGIVVIGVVVAPGVVAGGAPGIVVPIAVAPDVVIPGVAVAVVPPVWERAAPAPIAARTTANAAFLAAILMVEFLSFPARISRP
jgi:hypothetical protein